MKKKGLKNKKTAVISGASGDIGLACAEAFLNSGYRLILHSFRHPEKIINFIKKNPQAEIIHLNFDASLEECVKNGLAPVLNKKTGIKCIDVLINNAGDLIDRVPAEKLEWDFIQKTINVNVKSAFLFTKYFLPMMAKGASIIFISSSTAKYGKGDRSSAYGLAKGALLSWSRCLANELGSRGIAVNAITPGFIEGQFHKKYTAASVADAHRSKNPLRRLGRPKDVAAAALFLAEAHTNYISGACLDICGADYMS